MGQTPTLSKSTTAIKRVRTSARLHLVTSAVTESLAVGSIFSPSAPYLVYCPSLRLCWSLPFLLFSLFISSAELSSRAGDFYTDTVRAWDSHVVVVVAAATAQGLVVVNILQFSFDAVHLVDRLAPPPCVPGMAPTLSPVTWSCCCWPQSLATTTSLSEWPAGSRDPANNCPPAGGTDDISRTSHFLAGESTLFSREINLKKFDKINQQETNKKHLPLQATHQQNIFLVKKISLKAGVD